MQFLAPWFLAGLGLLAVPVLVHLTRRERARPTAFPSLMFLEHTPHELVRRRRVRDWPLLLLRCLAVLLLALAFARPFATRAAAAPAPGAGGRDVVILLDRSYSMGAPGRWARATAEVRRVVGGLAGGDRAALVLFDRTAAVAQPATDDGAALGRALDSARVGSGGTRYTPALALAARLLGASTRPRREAVLVTDFQRAGWQPDAEARLPAGVRLVAVDVGAAPAANVAVAGVELRRAAAERDGPGAGREQAAPVARVTSTAAEPRDVVVALDVNGREAERRTVRVPPNGAAPVAFAAVPLPDGPVRGTVRVDASSGAGATADALPADDALHFTASRAEVVGVLVLQAAGARADAGLYLRRALAVGDRPPFRVESRPAARLAAADLAGRDVVVLHDAPPPAAAARALVDFVRRGGGLVVALGAASGPSAWPAEAAALLPATPGGVVDRADDGGARLVAADRAHPVFEAFAAPRSGDLSAARVLRYRTLGGGAPLARFDDGAPALVEHAVGAGRVLVWTSTFDGVWNDLVRQPVFVPLVHRLATHAARHADAPAWRLVGETLDPGALAGAPRDAGAARWTVATPSGRTARLGGAAAPRALTLAEPGFYEVRRPDAPAERPGVVAVNVDRAESDLARVQPAEVTRFAEGDGAPRAAGDAAATPEEREGRQRAWWWLLAGALALLAAETLLADRRSRRAPRLPDPA